MKNLITLGLIFTLANAPSSCDSPPTNPATIPALQFDPPANWGTGEVLYFTGTDADDFHKRLNEHLTHHKNLRLETINQSDNTHWLVVVSTIVPPLPVVIPATQPDTSGEIHY